MRTAKKALGIVLVLAMLLNVVALVSYAAVPADTLVELTLKADKTTYAPGDEIVLTAYAQTAPQCQTVALHAQYEIAYNSSGIEPYATTDSIKDHGVVFDEAKFGPVDYANSEFVPWDTMQTLMTVTADSGCDQLVRYTISQDERVYNPSVDAPLELFSFKMRVSPTAADGDYTICFNQDSYDGYTATLMASFAGDGEEQELMGPSAEDYGIEGLARLFVCGSVNIHVGEAVVEDSIVKFGGNQIRFAGIKADGTGTYGHKFDIRSVATIAEADFATLLGAADPTEADAIAKTKITAAGFVYTSGAYNADDAKAAAGTGTTVNGHVDKKVSYIQHADGQYKFTCLTSNIDDADKNQSMTVLGYIIVDGKEPVFFSAEQVVDFAAVYDNAVANVKAQNPSFDPAA